MKSLEEPKNAWEYKKPGGGRCSAAHTSRPTARRRRPPPRGAPAATRPGAQKNKKGGGNPHHPPQRPPTPEGRRAPGGEGPATPHPARGQSKPGTKSEERENQGGAKAPEARKRKASGFSLDGQLIGIEWNHRDNPPLASLGARSYLGAAAKCRVL
jgi:hypothetical protein